MKKQSDGDYLVNLRLKGISEHEIQVAFFEWLDMMGKTEIPECALAFAIPNGGHRHISVAKKLKAEGVRAGVPDIMIPSPKNGFNGLFIEMKSPKGHLEPHQSDWLKQLNKQGYFTYCCWTLDEAIELVRYYFGKKVQKTFVPHNV